MGYKKQEWNIATKHSGKSISKCKHAWGKWSKTIDRNWHGLVGSCGVNMESWVPRLKKIWCQLFLIWAGSSCWSPTRKFFSSSRPGAAWSPGLSRGSFWREFQLVCEFFFFFWHVYILNVEISRFIHFGFI